MEIGERFREFKCREIVYLGIGGSAIAGDITSSLIEDLKISVHRDYPPIKISSDKLTIAVSYSGDTAELFPTLLNNIDTNPNIFIITSGGRLKKLAEKKNLPIVLLEPNIPPRYALPHTLGAILGLLKSLDIGIRNIEYSIDKVKRFHEKQYYTVPLSDNLAKRSATKIFGRVPVIYAYGKAIPIGYRLKCQLNENSKQFAHLSELPEALHNDVEAIREESILLVPRISDENETIIEIYRVLSEYFDERYVELKVDGDTLIEEVLSMLILVDYISLYLAVLKDADPMVLKVIPKLKEKNKVNEKILRSIDGYLEK
ncbi:MAG: hypothetical protein N3G77_06435 [Nitrososphaeria archaeon]|nr:hypothetical protein [Nitrososphaeria archaeon]MDW7985841.1 SIS domain-containing protein [Nitrososphaerota archaeon]